MKKYLLVLFSLVLFLLVACNKEESTAEPNDKENDKPEEAEEVELTFTIWGSDAHAEMYEKALQGFYDENPNIKVKIESIPFADYQQKLSVLAAGNELPDIGWVSEQMVPQFKDNNILTDISDFEKDADFNLKDFFPRTLDLWKHDGKLLGLPFSTPPMIIYFNKTLFEEAGLETPLELAKKGEWTWEKFEEAAKAIASGKGTDRNYGAILYTDTKNFSAIASHTFSYGGSMFSDDMKNFKWNSKQGVATFEMMDRMMFKDKSHVPPGETITFEGGKIGLFTGMYSYMGNVRKITDFKWDIAPMPEGTNGSKPLLGQAGIVAFTGSKHPEEAKALLKYLESQEGIKAQSAFFVPPRKSVLESDEFVNVPNNPPRESIEIAVIDQMNNGYLYPLHKDWTKIESEIIKGFDMLYSQMAPPTEILEQMETNITPLLK